MGCEPWRWTLRELLIAADAKQSQQFDAIACLMALTANLNRDPKHRRSPYEPREFHPWHVAQTRTDKARDGKISMTRSIFRAQARAWYERQGLPIPDKLKE